MRVQDKTAHEISKGKLIWCHKGPIIFIILIELLRGDIQTIGVIIDDVEIVNYILYIIPEEYDNIIETLEDNWITSLINLRY